MSMGSNTERTKDDPNTYDDFQRLQRGIAALFDACGELETYRRCDLSEVGDESKLPTIFEAQKHVAFARQLLHRAQEKLSALLGDAQEEARTGYPAKPMDFSAKPRPDIE